MKIFMLLGFLFVCEDIRAQVRKITGIVTDIYSGEFLSSASITIGGIRSGVTTNANGFFACHVTLDHAAFIISYAGYRTDTIQILSGQNHYIVEMTPTVNVLRNVEAAHGCVEIHVSKRDTGAGGCYFCPHH